MHFIYQPRSGDRVFVEYPGPHIAIVKYSNGCRHVVGGVKLEWFTAEPLRHWRIPATRALRELVQSFQEGIAWDEGGRVFAIVPPSRMETVLHFMRLIRPYEDREEDERNLGQVFRQGYAHIQYYDGRIEIRIHPPVKDPIICKEDIPGDHPQLGLATIVGGIDYPSKDIVPKTSDSQNAPPVYPPPVADYKWMPSVTQGLKNMELKQVSHKKETDRDVQ